HALHDALGRSEGAGGLRRAAGSQGSAQLMSTLIDRTGQGLALERTGSAGLVAIPGENTAEVARQAALAKAQVALAAAEADRSEIAAAVALGAVDAYEATDVADGLANTSEGEAFWVDNGDYTAS